MEEKPKDRIPAKGGKKTADLGSSEVSSPSEALDSSDPPDQVTDSASPHRQSTPKGFQFQGLSRQYRGRAGKQESHKMGGERRDRGDSQPNP